MIPSTEISKPDAIGSLHVQKEPIRVLISEPDAVSRRLMCVLLEYESGMTVTCVDDSKLVSSIQESTPDLVIVDVHTPAIKRCPNWQSAGIESAPITIVTAYDPSAMSEFASTAIDFLVKPFDAERFQTAIEVAKLRILRARIELGAEERSSGLELRPVRRQFLQRLAVEAGETIVLVRVEDILWFQSAGNYIRLHLKQTSHLVRRSIKNLQAVLDPSCFLRVHRNAIVNLDHVEEFHLPPTGNMFVKLNNEVCLPLRRGNRALLRKQLKNIS